MSELVAWAQANPEVAVAIVIYVIANFAPRPDHTQMDGLTRAFWQIIDRLCVLTHDKVPGAFKMVLLDSPPKTAALTAAAAEPPKPGEACRLCGAVEPELEEDVPVADDDADEPEPSDNDEADEGEADEGEGEAEAPEEKEQGAKET